jgi:tetratricopeptide (TPR) repeat protein
MHTANWLTFSCGLFYRCRAEHHRTKTVERAGFQLQALVDQYRDEKPSAAHRLLVVHGAGYPVRFHQQRELGVRMMRLGMVSSAFEQFKKLRMWPDCVDCLMVAGRKAECLDLVNDLLKTKPTPRLYCAIGDVEADTALENYQKAWELSGHRYARAARSIGRHYFTKHKLPEAIEWFLKATAINPLHQSIWFTCGVAQMRLERYDDAVLSFTRCVGVEEDNSEAWANLASTHVARNDYKQARGCMSEACRRARGNWRMWESFIGICLKLRDIQGVINGMRRLVELECAERIDEKMLGMITGAVINDAEGLYEDTRGRRFAFKLLDFYKFITSRCASVPFYWHFFSEMQLLHDQPEAALDSRLKQARAEQAKLWIEADPEKFAKGLSDLIACFAAIAESLEDSDLREKAVSHLQPFAYSARNAEKQLQGKLEKCLQVPEAWAAAHAKLSSLAEAAEKSAGAVDSKPCPDGGYPA